MRALAKREWSLKYRRLTPKQLIMAAERREKRFRVLPLDQLRGLPRVCYGSNEPGVYFLWEGPQLVYVGQSENVAVRVSQHIYFNKVFSRATFLPTHRNCLRTFEGRYVRRYDPPYNLTRHG